MEVGNGVVVLDDFLHPDDWSLINEILNGPDIEWFFVDGVHEGSKDQGIFQFVHRLFNDHQIKSRYFCELLLPLLYNLSCMSLIKSKINLQTNSCSNVEKGYHVDIEGHFSHRTAIYCVNTCNGMTSFRDIDLQVESRANRLIDFPSNLVHTGVSQTDQNCRILFTITYCPHDQRVLSKAVEPYNEVVQRFQ